MTTMIPRGNVQQMFIAQVAVDPANPGAAGTTEVNITVPGVKLGDMVFVSKPSVTSGYAVASARVSAADTVTYTAVATGAASPGSETYTILVLRPDVPSLPSRIPG